MARIGTREGPFTLSGETHVTSLVGKTVVVTGGSGGLGFQTAIALAGMGARLVIVGRDRARGEIALNYFRQASRDAVAEAHYADLSASTRSAGSLRRLRKSSIASTCW